MQIKPLGTIGNTIFFPFLYVHPFPFIGSKTHCDSYLLRLRWQLIWKAISQTINRFDSSVVPFSLVFLLPSKTITDFVVYEKFKLILTIFAWCLIGLLSHTIENDCNFGVDNCSKDINTWNIALFSYPHTQQKNSAFFRSKVRIACISNWFQSGKKIHVHLDKPQNPKAKEIRWKTTKKLDP